MIPALDEAPNVARVLDDVRALTAVHRVRVVLVDDGSTDGTAEAAGAAAGAVELEVLRHPRTLGPGRAFATAFEHLAGLLEPDDVVVTLEADNTSRLEILPTMLGRLDEGYEGVLASPYMYGGAILQTDALRVAASHLANSFLKGALGIRGIHTMSSFYRAHHAGLILRLQHAYGPGIVERAGFESMPEMLLKMIYAGASLTEVPMVLDTGRRVGASKMKFVRTARGYLALAVRRRRWRAAASGVARSP